MKNLFYLFITLIILSSCQKNEINTSYNQEILETINYQNLYANNINEYEEIYYDLEDKNQLLYNSKQNVPYTKSSKTKSWIFNDSYTATSNTIKFCADQFLPGEHINYSINESTLTITSISGLYKSVYIFKK